MTQVYQHKPAHIQQIHDVNALVVNADVQLEMSFAATTDFRFTFKAHSTELVASAICSAVIFGVFLSLSHLLL